MLMPLQGVTNGCALTQGVASLALGYALVGLSARALSAAYQAIQASLIAFVLHDKILPLRTDEYVRCERSNRTASLSS